MLKKDTFKLTPAIDQGFDELKNAMTSGLVLALLNFSKSFIVECDAFGMGLGVVLKQRNWPNAFFSQALQGKNIVLSTYKKEILPLVKAVQKWWPYLLGAQFIVCTYQKSL